MPDREIASSTLLVCCIASVAISAASPVYGWTYPWQEPKQDYAECRFEAEKVITPTLEKLSAMLALAETCMIAKGYTRRQASCAPLLTSRYEKEDLAFWEADTLERAYDKCLSSESD